MAANLNIHRIDSPVATELYITATPQERLPLEHQAREILSEVRNVLGSERASVLQERVFGTQEAVRMASRIRTDLYGDIDDGVAPSLLMGKEGISGPLAGVHVHAVISKNRPEVISLQETLCGRVLRVPGRAYLTLSSISAPQLAGGTEQAEAILRKAELILKRFGADFFSVPRTWMWLCDILSWYDDFNQVRNKFFTERQLIGDGTRQSMPASTGIGLCVADGSKCAMDLTAVLEPSNSIQFFQAVGKQQCALEYGSAFSRASRATTPAAETVFVSGTASIDANGNTTNIGDSQGQINATVENVRAVLKDTQTGDDQVVQAVAYCKTSEVEQIFKGVKPTLTWPTITVICDICRPDLLFEMEVTACKPATH